MHIREASSGMFIVVVLDSCWLKGEVEVENQGEAGMNELIGRLARDINDRRTKSIGALTVLWQDACYLERDGIANIVI